MPIAFNPPPFPTPDTSIVAALESTGEASAAPADAFAQLLLAATGEGAASPGAVRGKAPLLHPRSHGAIAQDKGSPAARGPRVALPAPDDAPSLERTSEAAAAAEAEPPLDAGAMGSAWALFAMGIEPKVGAKSDASAPAAKAQAPSRGVLLATGNAAANRTGANAESRLALGAAIANAEPRVALGGAIADADPRPALGGAAIATASAEPPPELDAAILASAGQTPIASAQYAAGSTAATASSSAAAASTIGIDDAPARGAIASTPLTRGASPDLRGDSAETNSTRSADPPAFAGIARAAAPSAAPMGAHIVGTNATQNLEQTIAPGAAGTPAADTAPAAPVDQRRASAQALRGDAEASTASDSLAPAPLITAPMSEASSAAATARALVGDSVTRLKEALERSGSAASAQSIATAGLAPPAAPTAAQTIATPVGAPGFEEEFAGKLANIITLRHDRVEFHLHPAELGPVDVQVSFASDQAVVLITAPQAATRDALEQALPHLRDMLAGQGITLGQASVQQGEQNGAERGGFGRGEKLASVGAAHAAADVAAPSRRSAGLVDIFA